MLVSIEKTTRGWLTSKGCMVCLTSPFFLLTFLRHFFFFFFDRKAHREEARRDGIQIFHTYAQQTLPGGVSAITTVVCMRLFV